ncbi:ABC transporter substrate-binding protein [Flammeovirga yaeyamensis]|uniref:ABC transporter substrate-binding protein n=1 Tax=Flammeovirga yaeyamensis TaxID=367791 RepID=A0AAX1N3H7_9BACT|nr:MULTISPECIES: ABC transporter substrate-binding protein [Flammeovirga]ANQ50493.2 ABC transporter substrate-binding protein [Flammeovirga sp. MY04]MBB3700665.1 peptide/nickel transport system substrate-binding protein [Flammeovirga yaeyamensis]NMF37777.1 ABC transporter substrate-binding protein [Flammeovirga yaeyamensis]QWG02084.1 ABC transporter substrate-binding protein [Flammeovirga yaeyamensis]
MRKLTAVTLSFLFLYLFTGCGNSNNERDNAQMVLTPAKGGKFYGGVFKVNEAEYIKNLFPLSIIDIYSYRVASQIYEGLFKFDQKSLQVVPSLVKSYAKSDDQLVYTFKLKDNVYFHDDKCFEGGKGRKFTAQDVFYSFNLITTYNKNNQYAHLFTKIVEGAEKYYQSTKLDPNFSNSPEGLAGVSGFKVIDELTFEITLVKPNSMFLYNLARPGSFIFPKEAYETYGEDMRTKCVGTGPYQIASVDEDISIILSRNDNYHGKDEHGNQLPFLKAIDVSFVKDKKIEFLKFKKGELDMMYRVPTEDIINILAESDESNQNFKYHLQRTPEMSTQFLAMNNMGKVFKDINVRKAFSFAVDRQRILELILNGEGYMEGYFGITPPVFENYNIEDIKGYKHNIDSAKYYLAKAGYPEGKGFPQVTLDLNTEGEQYSNVALEVKKQLKDKLNIEVELKISPFAQIAEKSIMGRYDFLRLAWIADYPSPENYLWAYYSKNLPKNPEDKSWPNLIRYKNPRFDVEYEKALLSNDEATTLSHFKKAEKILMEDAPFIVLWYDEGYRLIQRHIRDFPNNPMQYRDFSTVYFEKSN